MDINSAATEPAADSRDAIHRTVITVEVFSRGPYDLSAASTDNDPYGLAAISYDVTFGDCIGAVQVTSTEVVPSEQVEPHLVRIGNDGTFFDPV